jgi:hypothetical protein
VLITANTAGIETEIPAWNGLLLVYGSLYLPVIFAMLFELNLDAWVNARINYEVCSQTLAMLIVVCHGALETCPGFPVISGGEQAHRAKGL